MTDFLTIGQVARELGVPRWRLAYWLERGDLPQPTLAVPGRRLFSRSDVERIKKLLRIGDDVEGSRTDDVIVSAGTGEIEETAGSTRCTSSGSPAGADGGATGDGDRECCFARG